MDRLVWTPQAVADVSRLYRFVAQHDPESARRAAGTIRETAGRLALYPHSGRPVAEMDPEFREWIVEFGSGGYLILYRFDGTEVVILAVRHTREAGY